MMVEPVRSSAATWHYLSISAEIGFALLHSPQPRILIQKDQKVTATRTLCPCSLSIAKPLSTSHITVDHRPHSALRLTHLYVYVAVLLCSDHQYLWLYDECLPSCWLTPCRSFDMGRKGNINANGPRQTFKRTNKQSLTRLVGATAQRKQWTFSLHSLSEDDEDATLTLTWTMNILKAAGGNAINLVFDV